MIIILIFAWLIIAAAIGKIGDDREIGFSTPFFLSLLLSPIVGGFYALSSPLLSTIEFQKKVLELLEKNNLDPGTEISLTADNIGNKEISSEAILLGPPEPDKDLAQKVIIVVGIIVAIFILFLYFSQPAD